MQLQPSLNFKNSRRMNLFLVAIIVGIVSYWNNRNGILTTPDSWAYWEGSISIIEENKFAFLGRGEIYYWPPLFSLYLAFIQMLLNQTGFSLIIAMSFISALNSFIWSNYVRKIFDQCNSNLKRIALISSLIFVNLFILQCSAVLLAQFMMLTFIGIIFNSLLDIRNAFAIGKYSLKILILAIAILLGLLTHNSMIIFLFATIFILVVEYSQPLVRRLLSSLFILVIPLVTWVAVRNSLNQTYSHAQTQSLYKPSEYILQTINGIGYFFVSSLSQLQNVRYAVGLIFVSFVIYILLFRKKLKLDKFFRTSFLLVIISFIILYVLFNVIWIDSQLADRFLWYIPLATVPIFLYVLREKKVILYLVILLLLGFSSVKNIRSMLYGTVSPVSIAQQEVFDNNIHPWYYLSSRTNLRIPPGSKQISPPTFPWMTRWRQLPLPESEKKKIRIIHPPSE